MCDMNHDKLSEWVEGEICTGSAKPPYPSRL